MSLGFSLVAIIRERSLKDPRRKSAEASLRHIIISLLHRPVAEGSAAMYLLLICHRVRRGSVSYSGAVDDEFDPAISLAALGGVIRSDGLRFSEAARGDG